MGDEESPITMKDKDSACEVKQEDEIQSENTADIGPASERINWANITNDGGDNETEKQHSQNIGVRDDMLGINEQLRGILKPTPIQPEGVKSNPRSWTKFEDDPPASSQGKPVSDNSVSAKQQALRGLRGGGGTSSKLLHDDSPPPSYGSISPIFPPHFITCRVCQQQIDITNKREHFVAKCTNCNEATPIQSPPPGKKYVRCSCNCLLVCNATAQRILCPRPHCKRIIELRVVSGTPAVPENHSGSNDNVHQIRCAHCSFIFLFNTTSGVLAKCPHCSKVSSVGSDYARTRAIFYLILGIILLLLSIGFTIGMVEMLNQYFPYYIIYLVACFAVSFWFLWKSWYYFRMKISNSVEDRPM